MKILGITKELKIFIIKMRGELSKQNGLISR